MVRRADIVSEAESFIGTPFVHQGQLKGVGVDCVGFIKCVAENTGAVPDVEFEANYRRHEDGENMARLFRAYMEPLADWREALPGDVFVVGFKGRPRHCMIVAERAGDEFEVIEADRERVTKHRIDQSTKRRIHSAYRVRGLSD